MSVNPLDHPGDIFDMALMSPNPTSSKNKDGPVYRVSFEVERELWDCFMDAKTAGMLIACKATVVAHDEGDQLAATTKQQKGIYGEQAKVLRQSGFFRSPDVWRLLGTDADYLEWLKLQKCAVRKMGNCNGQVVPAHVRRVANGAGTGIKPDYSAIPMCDGHHQIQHAKGESAVGGRSFFEAQKIKYVEMWAWSRMKAILDVESFTDVAPATLIEWAVRNDVDRYLPASYK